MMCANRACMDRTDPDTIVIAAGFVITLITFMELYPLLTRSDTD